MNHDDAAIQVALNITADAEDRRRAIDALVASATDRAALAVLTIAERDKEEPDMLRAAGKGLARFEVSGRTWSEFDLRNVQPIAYEAFCDWAPDAID